jgi:hypothetical protein
MNIIPNIAWYTGISQDKQLPPRCPFATVNRCPRYYQSLALLGHAGSTKLDPAEDAKLLKKWKASELWPKTAEQETSIMGASRTFNFNQTTTQYDRFFTTIGKHLPGREFDVRYVGTRWATYP